MATKPRALNHRQRIVLDFIVRYIATNERSPTYREIAGFLGIKSRQGAQQMVVRLIRRGLLTHVPRHKQALRPTERYLGWRQRELAEAELARIQQAKAKEQDDVDSGTL